MGFLSYSLFTRLIPRYLLGQSIWSLDRSYKYLHLYDSIFDLMIVDCLESGAIALVQGMIGLARFEDCEFDLPLTLVFLICYTK